MARYSYQTRFNRRGSYNGRQRWYRRAYYGARRAYTRSNARNGYNKAVRLNSPLTWIAGAAIGLLDVDDKIPAELKVGLANMPLTGSVAGRVRSVAAGMCFGDLLQKNILPRAGIVLGNAGNTANTAGNGVSLI